MRNAFFLFLKVLLKDVVDFLDELTGQVSIPVVRYFSALKKIGLLSKI